MFCTNCGKEVPAGSKFCIHCGAPMAQQEPQGSTPVEEKAVPAVEPTPAAAPQPQPRPQAVPQPVPQPAPVPQQYQQQVNRPVQAAPFQNAPQQSAPQQAPQFVPQQPAMQQPMNGYPQAPANFQKKKGGAGKVIGIIAAVILILAAVGIVSQTFLKNEPVRKFESAMADKDYATAGSLINQIENDSKRADAIQQYIREGESIVCGYTSGQYSYEEASQLLSTLSKSFPNMGVELTIVQLDNEKNAQEYFQWGEENESKGEYLDAVWDYSLIEPDTALYDEAQGRIEQLKEPYLAQVLERADRLAKEGDYEGALQLLEESEVYGADERVTAKRTEFESAQTGTNADGKYLTVADFINSDAIQEEIADLTEQMSDIGMDIRVHGEGNKLVYTYVYGEIVDGIDLDLLGSLLDEALDEQSDTFEMVAESLKEAVAVENPIVVVEYLTPDGQVLSYREFTAD